MNAVEQNVEINKHQGHIKAKDLKVTYLKNGTILQRRDVVIAGIGTCTTLWTRP